MVQDGFDVDPRQPPFNFAFFQKIKIQNFISNRVSRRLSLLIIWRNRVVCSLGKSLSFIMMSENERIDVIGVRNS